MIPWRLHCYYNDWCFLWGACPLYDQDHGPFNSWDRQPFLTTVRNGTASLIPARNVLTKNFVMANYNANGGCFDNDDGMCLSHGDRD